MPNPIVAVPADLWDNIKLFISDTIDSTSPHSLREMLESANGIDVPKLDDESEHRRERIIEILGDSIPWVRQGEVEIDRNARISEGGANGCYVSGWVWCDFAGTEFDKSCASCGEVEDDISNRKDSLCEPCQTARIEESTVKEVSIDED